MTLHVERVGSGPDLVMLHGWGLHGGIWAPVRDALAQHFTLHIVDLPGHGHSRDTGFSGLPAMAALITKELPSEYSLLGWSLGGHVSMYLALQPQANIRKLVLTAATPSFVRREGWEHAKTPAVLADFAARLQLDYRKTLLNFLALQTMGDADSRRILHAMRDTLFARGEPHPEVLTAGLNVLAASDLRAQIPDIRQPTLVIHGDHDALTPMLTARWLASNMPNARLMEIERCAHAPFLSHPDLFVKSVSDFLLEP